MNGVGKVFKDGWHPEKGGKSWREDHSSLNTAARLVGKGKTNRTAAAYSHQSAPLSTLKDPTEFGRPPKRVDSDELPVITSPKSPTAITSGNSQRQITSGAPPTPARTPYKIDTSGLSTAHLPKPPVRGALDSPTQTTAVAAVASKPKPKLPPRLPPRQSTQEPSSPPPPYTSPTSSSPSRLQAFHQATTNSSGGYTNQFSPNRAQLADVTKAVSAFSKPGNSATGPKSSSGISLSEAAALNKQYGITQKISENPALARAALNQVASTAPAIGAAAEKRPPPPPPPKKRDTGSDSPRTPPPLPLASKPRF